MSPFEMLPDELILIILCKLLLQDINRMALVSSRMYAMASTPKLWANMIVSKRRLRKLGIDHLKTIKRLQDLASLDLSGIPVMSLTTAQYEKVLSFTLNSKLKSLNLSCVKMDYSNIYSNFYTQMPCSCALANISPDLLARAVNHLEAVNLSGSYVIVEQAIAIFKHILVSTNLSDLSIGGLELREMPVDLFVNALAKIKSVQIFATNTTGLDRLFHSNVSIDQLKALLLKLQEETVLKTLDIEGRSFLNLGLSFVDSSHLDLNGRILTKWNNWAKDTITQPVRIYSKLKINSEVYKIVRHWERKQIFRSSQLS